MGKFSPKRLFLMLILLFAACGAARAHPHVFVEASLEVIRDDAGRFSELRHVWRFDELFSATIILDYDKDGDGALDEAELKDVTTTVKKSIAEYSFFTAIRAGTRVIEFYEPDQLSAYMDDNQLIMFFAVEPAEKYAFDDGPLKLSASDESFYVAFEFSEDTVSVGGNSEQCKISVTNPDFDQLLSENSQMLSEAYFSNPDKPDVSDEFYSWAIITC